MGPNFSKGGGISLIPPPRPIPKLPLPRELKPRVKVFLSFSAGEPDFGYSPKGLKVLADRAPKGKVFPKILQPVAVFPNSLRQSLSS